MKLNFVLRRHWRYVTLTGWLGVAVLGSLSAQSSDSELERVEEAYLLQRDHLVRPHLNAYADQLRQLRATYSARRDARLGAVDDEIQRVSRLLALHPLPLSGLIREEAAAHASTSEDVGAQQISLLPSRARLVGGAMYDTVETPAIHFSSLNQGAEWRLPVLRPGRWQIRLAVACQPNGHATARLVLAGYSPLLVRIEPTGKEGELLSLNLGEIDIVSAPSSLRIEMSENSSPSSRSRLIGHFSLAEVILTPVAKD